MNRLGRQRRTRAEDQDRRTDRQGQQAESHENR
jgi:hypothetical protein